MEPYFLPAGFLGGMGRARPKSAARSSVISRIRVRLTAVPFHTDRTEELDDTNMPRLVLKPDVKGDSHA
jgi:hypothetical protein